MRTLLLHLALIGCCNHTFLPFKCYAVLCRNTETWWLALNLLPQFDHVLVHCKCCSRHCVKFVV